MMTKLMGLVAIGIVLPSTVVATNNSALATEIKIKTDNIEAVTKSDGSTYINTGDTTVQVPRRRSWTPWRYWRFPWQNYSNHSTSLRSNCRHSSNQSTERIRGSGSTIVQSSFSSSTCN